MPIRQSWITGATALESAGIVLDASTILVPEEPA